MKKVKKEQPEITQVTSADFVLPETKPYHPFVYISVFDFIKEDRLTYKCSGSEECEFRIMREDPGRVKRKWGLTSDWHLWLWSTNGKKHKGHNKLKPDSAQKLELSKLRIEQELVFNRKLYRDYDESCGDEELEELGKELAKKAQIGKLFFSKIKGELPQLLDNVLLQGVEFPQRDAPEDLDEEAVKKEPEFRKKRAKRESPEKMQLAFDEEIDIFSESDRSEAVAPQVQQVPQSVVYMA